MTNNKFGWKALFSSLFTKIEWNMKINFKKAEDHFPRVSRDTNILISMEFIVVCIQRHTHCMVPQTLVEPKHSHILASFDLTHPLGLWTMIFFIYFERTKHHGRLRLVNCSVDALNFLFSFGTSRWLIPSILHRFSFRVWFSFFFLLRFWIVKWIGDRSDALKSHWNFSIVCCMQHGNKCPLVIRAYCTDRNNFFLHSGCANTPSESCLNL